ncbi:EcoEI R protein [Rhodococcus sp. AG1013]|uniref:type I restriction-modification enzyme R subunit C-terminal domain-containing protein n=1 Tax=Rhodococcus sp. AG1013 TaxID=2183996 RepID=UPI000E2DBCB8|nr:type I restriction-modification enzyme R subunit C-terminal domain-containing protein [Rhodococcus sp. AG1013]RDI16453.1 EcoEI R protein [Rhodococcus sp. AG1013]
MPQGSSNKSKRPRGRDADRAEWDSLSEQRVAEIIENLAPLPTTVRDTDELAKRFDLIVLRGQLAVVHADGTLPKFEAPIRQVADGLLDEGLNIPKVRDYLRRQPDNLALSKVRHGKPLTTADPASLEEMLARSGAGEPQDLERAVENAKGLARFIRSLVGLDQQSAAEAFAEFLHGKTATADQIDFVNLIISHLTRHGEMDPSLLFESPFTDKAPHGPGQVFGDDQVMRLVQVIRSINESVDTTDAASA